MAYYGSDSSEEDKYVDSKYKGHIKGYSYEGNGYYSNLHGGSDMYWDVREQKWSRSM